MYMKNLIRIILGIYFLVYLPILGTAKPAIIISPVADCVNEPMSALQRKVPSLTYQNMPICARGTSYICPRIHQLLFNQQITVLEEVKNEVKVRVPHMYFQIPGTTEKFNIFWLQKKDIVLVEDLKKKNIQLDFFPSLIEQITGKKNKPTPTTITLIVPFFDHVNRRLFSAGTKFVTAKKQPSSSTHIKAYAFNPKTYTIEYLNIPKKNVIATNKLTQNEHQMMFVRILKKWTQAPGSFPYVWGGCSLGFNYKKHAIHKKYLLGKEYYHVPCPKNYPFMGVDCSGMIWLAAYISGLPFPYKNSATIKQNLRHLAPHEKIEAGDILWIPGHVMVVADIKHNTLFEARHYSAGYGKLHELPLASMFKDISTYQDLQLTWQYKKPLALLNSKQCVSHTIKDFAILKLSSIW